jgi:hypothetical protein
MPPTCRSTVAAHVVPPRVPRWASRWSAPPGSRWIAVTTTSARARSSATSTNAKISGWPNTREPASPRPATGGPQRPLGSSGLDRHKDIRRDHPGSPLLVRVARDRCTRWHVDNPAGARSGRRSPSAALFGITGRRRTHGLHCRVSGPAGGSAVRTTAAGRRHLCRGEVPSHAAGRTRIRRDPPLISQDGTNSENSCAARWWSASRPAS